MSSLRFGLPDIPIPLKPNDQPVVVHLQAILAGVYDRGRFTAASTTSRRHPRLSSQKPINSGDRSSPKSRSWLLHR